MTTDGGTMTIGTLMMTGRETGRETGITERGGDGRRGTGGELMTIIGGVGIIHNTFTSMISRAVLSVVEVPGLINQDDQEYISLLWR